MSRTFRLAGIFSLTLLGAAPLLAGCTPNVVVEPASGASASANTVTVLGSGEVFQKPDIARASVGVEVSAPTVADATQRATQQMNDLIAALKKAGLADKDIQTSNFSINFERSYPHYPPIAHPAAAAPAETPPAPAKKGGAAKSAPVPAATPAVAPASTPVAPPQEPPGFYRVSNTVTITIRDIGKVGPVLDAAVASGANNVWGVSFGIDKPEALEPEARAKAMADAKSRAESLAKLAGRTLGDVLSVSEVLRGGNSPLMTLAMAKDAYGGTPIEAGQVAVSAQVEVVYRFAEAQKPKEE